MAAVATHRFMCWPPHWTKTNASSCRDLALDAPHPTGVADSIARLIRRCVYPWFYIVLFGLVVGVPLVAAAGILHPPSKLFGLHAEWRSAHGGRAHQLG